MSMHRSDYLSFASGLLNWFGQATAAGMSSKTALQNVAMAALTTALQQMEPAAPVQAAPSIAQPPDPAA